MGTLIPNQPLIYERANGVVFARYRDPPYNMIERWVVGGEPKAVAEAKGVVDNDEWKDIIIASQISDKEWCKLHKKFFLN